MKPVSKITLIVLFFFLSVKLIAQKNNSKPTASPTVKLKSAEDSMQYALGVYLGKFVISTGVSSINPTILLSGMDDMLKNKSRLISDSNIVPILNTYQDSKQKQLGKNLEEQLFASLKDKPGVGKLPSGVQYTILRAGTGIRPSQNDSIVINFKGVLANGTVFEDTYAKQIAIATTPGTVMPGLNEALQLMPMGSMWQLYIPSVMAYGEKGNPPVIPPNSALVMIVDLVLVKRNG